jgi:hypothetical protein
VTGFVDGRDPVDFARNSRFSLSNELKQCYSAFHEANTSNPRAGGDGKKSIARPLAGDFF